MENAKLTKTDSSENLLGFLFANYYDRLALPYKNIKEVIDNLEEFIDETEYSDFSEYVYMIHWKYLTVAGDMRTLKFGKGTVDELIVEIRKFLVDKLPQIKNSDTEIDGEEDFILTDIFKPTLHIFERNYGYGKKDKFFKLIRGQLYEVNMPRSTKTCLLKCVSLATGTPLEVLKKRYSRSNYSNIRKYVESCYDINYDWKNYDEDAINIYAVGNHAGLITKVEEDNFTLTLPDMKYFSQEIKSVANKDVIIVVIDFEFDWEVTDNPKLRKASPPKIGSMVWKTPGSTKSTVVVYRYKPKYPNVVKQVVNQLKLISSGHAQHKIFCYSSNGRGVEHIILNKELLETNNGSNQYISNVEGTKVKSFNMGNILFIDSYLLFPASLDNFCKAMGVSSKIKIEDVMVEKGYWPAEQKSTFMTENKWMSGPSEKDKIEVEYCKHDSVCLMNALEKYNKYLFEIMSKFGLPVEDRTWLLCRPSISGIAHSLLTAAYKISTTPKEYMEMLLPSFIGGRTEIFKKGRSQTDDKYQLHAQDINSSYPFQMTKGIANNILRIDIRPEYELDTSRNWLAKCSVRHTSACGIGKLAVRTDDCVIFPTRSFNCWIHNFEVEDDVEILDCQIVIYYDLLDISTLINSLYDERLKVGKNGPMGLTIKTVLNSSYGRFAMKTGRDTNCVIQDVDEFTDRYHNAFEYTNVTMAVSKIENLTSEMDWFTVNMKGMHMPDVNYLAASRITALARLQLYSKLVELKADGCIPVYSDTDSIYYLRPKHLPRPLSGSKLGEWDLDDYTAINVKALKVYQVDDKVKYKGVSKPTSLSKTQNMSVWMRKNFELYNADVEKTSEFNYNKGRVSKTTGLVKPYKLKLDTTHISIDNALSIE
jgi:hypothetical protein